MGRQVVVVLYVLALVAVVVGVDVLFFRQFRSRRKDAPMPVVGSRWAVERLILGASETRCTGPSTHP